MALFLPLLPDVIYNAANADDPPKNVYRKMSHNQQKHLARIAEGNILNYIGSLTSRLASTFRECRKL